MEPIQERDARQRVAMIERISDVEVHVIMEDGALFPFRTHPAAASLFCASLGLLRFAEWIQRLDDAAREEGLGARAEVREGMDKVIAQARGEA